MSGALGRVVAAATLAAVLVLAGAHVPASPGGLPAVLGPVPAAAATPEPSQPAAGDTRSPGEGPGFVGTPLVAIGAVAAIGLASVLATLAYLRLTGGPRRKNS